MYSQRYEHDAAFAEEYALGKVCNVVSLKEGDVFRAVEFPLGSRIIKVKTLFDFDGLRANISKSDGGYFGITLANPLLVSAADEDYLKKLHAVNDKISNCEKVRTKYHISEKHDKITREQNLRLYDLLCEKINSKPFRIKLSDVGKTFVDGRSKFERLDDNEQVKTLVSMVSVFKTGRASACDLKLIGGSTNSARMKINCVLSKVKDIQSIRIIDQSPAGLYEKASPNLLTL